MAPNVGKKIRRTAISGYHEVDRYLRGLGLRYANEDYTRFIILGRGRTGSTMLKTALSQHSEIVMYGEVFRGRPRWDTRFGLRRQPANQAILDDPHKFASEIIYRKYSSEIKAVGVKLFYAHAQAGSGEELWSYLRDDENLHVIHLRRRNILQTFLSSRLARRSGQWNIKSESNIQGDGEIVIDFEECRQFFEETRSNEIQFSEYFAGHQTLNIWYEDLLQDYAEQMLLVQNFLGVTPEPIKPLTQKKGKRPLTEQIANYDELKEQFADTEWSQFFIV